MQLLPYENMEIIPWVRAHVGQNTVQRETLPSIKFGESEGIGEFLIWRLRALLHKVIVCNNIGRF